MTTVGRTPFTLLARLPLWILVLLAQPVSLAAQAEPETGWKFSGQLTGVWTSGNAESSTFGAGLTIRHKSSVSELKLEGGGIRTDASKTTRRAVGSPTAYRIEEEEIRETTAETYFTRARYDRIGTAGMVVFFGADVLRNTFAGIDSRVLMAAGAGKLWIDNETARFKMDVGVTYTFQDDIVNNPFLKSSFPGTRLTAELQRKMTSTTRLETMLVSDLNFSDTNDLRTDWTTALPVTVSTAISLKPAVQLLWRNQPALREVALFNEDGTAANAVVTQPFEKLDTLFTLALVVTL